MSRPHDLLLAKYGGATIIALWALLVCTPWGSDTCRAQESPPAARSHKGLFYDNDFSYLLAPDAELYLGDTLKRMPFGSCVTYDIGGQFRLRHHSERNHRGLGLTGRDDDFLLYRTRIYLNMQFGSALRAYVEMLDAVSNYESFAPRPIEENRTDLQNLFGDVRLWSTACGELWGRLGRQEVLYGNQRVLSPLDWANTRRTFEGYKLFWRSERWDVDAFWVRPISPDPDHFDSPDYDRQFAGVYVTRRLAPKRALDLYTICASTMIAKTSGSTRWACV
ncbi:hypothetical protein JCM19992_19100 [Thermostilla marina]